MLMQGRNYALSGGAPTLLAHRCSLCENFHTYIKCEVKHNAIWRWGINGVNGWGIYDSNGWGIYDSNGWDIYDSNGWDS